MAGVLLIPLLSLAGLWAFAASTALGNVIRDQHYNTIVNTVAPSVLGLEKTLEPERALTLAWLSGDHRSPRAPAQLIAARRGTDGTVAAFLSATAAVRGLLSATEQGRLRGVLADLAGLARIREAVDAGTDSPVAAFTAYSAISSDEYAFLQGATPPVDPTLSLMTQSSIAETRAEDLSAGATALVEVALAGRGQMTESERVLFDQVVAEQNLAIDDTFGLADPELAALFGRIFDSPAYHQLLATEDQITSSPVDQPIPVRPAAYHATTLILQRAMSSFDQPQIRSDLDSESAQLSDRLLTELCLAGGLGLAAVVASVFIMVRFARTLRGELTSLYLSARQIADERLPQLVERLRRGEDVDVAAESPPLQPGRITEIASVVRAFSIVQRTAVEAAADQASLRKAVNRVFASLSLRNQSLLHRQLGMLDRMERATSDPVALADLFRLDHLTTRMRRHAEGLLILAGATPGRGWNNPVPVVDVLNAAVAEIEDYVRVDVVCECADAVAGTAVTDVIHLLAELVENAAVFSPPDTRVEIRGDAVGRGFAVEIEDQGLGMPEEDIAAHNERLAAPPEFDLSNGDQLGLFVAATLAARHQVGITLRQSPLGGTTAIVLLPPGIMVPAPATSWALDAPNEDGPPSGPVNGLAREHVHAGGGGPAPAFALTGRHRRPGSAPESRPVRGFPSATPALESAALTPGGWFGRGLTRSGNAASNAGFSTQLADTRLDDAASDDAELRGAAPGGSRTDLPRRERQASLAPQMRNRFSSAPAAVGRRSPGAVREGPAERSPEEAGSTLSALQAGWERARITDLDQPEGEDQQ
jgi:signal transduction histidine kinase